MSGAAALVLPVRRGDDTPAVLKLQPVGEETVGEPVALRAWAGNGAVRLLDHDPATGAVLLERLDPTRSLASLPDDLAALQILSELLARLVTVPAPAGLRRLTDIAGGMLDQLPEAVSSLADSDDRRLIRSCAAAVADQLPATAARLLHWDLHYENVLAAHREPWLAIDPKPLAGDPGFELLPALRNRWEDAIATGNPAGRVLHRFDLMVDVLSLDRSQAASWTLGRVLQNALWDTAAGRTTVDPAQRLIARTLLARSG